MNNLKILAEFVISKVVGYENNGSMVFDIDMDDFVGEMEEFINSRESISNEEFQTHLKEKYNEYKNN